MRYDIIEKCINEHQKTIDIVKQSMIGKIAEAAVICADALKRGNKIMLCGNGGSAADSQHIAAELIGRFQTERKGLAAVALTTDTSIITAVSNDYGFHNVFARQVEGLGREGDVLIGISTSGNSGNVLVAIEMAKSMGIKTIGLTGRDGGKIEQICSICLNVPAQVTARVQEAHILIGHILCELLDDLSNEE